MEGHAPTCTHRRLTGLGVLEGKPLRELAWGRQKRWKSLDRIEGLARFGAVRAGRQKLG